MQAELDAHGFAVLPGALSEAEHERLTAAVDRVYGERARPGEPLHELGFVGLDDSFVELVAHPVTLPAVQRALGWNIYLYHCHLDVHPPLRDERPEPWRWHQDGGRQNLELESPRPRLSVKVAYFLTDVSAAEQGLPLGDSGKPPPRRARTSPERLGQAAGSGAAARRGRNGCDLRP